ncbi:hypothetical protein AgCh_024666 [Apium graveolens]
MIARLETLVQYVNTKLEEMPSHRDRTSQYTLQMIADELQSIVKMLREEKTTKPRSCHPKRRTQQPHLPQILIFFDYWKPYNSKINDIAKQQRTLQQQFENQDNCDPYQPPDPPVPPRQVITFKAFQNVNPPAFQDTTDPVIANTWIREMERAFELVQLGDDQKTPYATYFLKGEVIYWWDSVKAMEANQQVSWERFKKLFLEKYYLKYMQNQMELKFLELKQGSMTVLEYEKKFTELSRFVTKYTNSEEEKAKRFQQGLESWIRDRVAMCNDREITLHRRKSGGAAAYSSSSGIVDGEGERRKAGLNHGVVAVLILIENDEETGVEGTRFGRVLFAIRIAEKIPAGVFVKGVDKDDVVLMAARASRLENQDAIDSVIVTMLADPKQARAGITEIHFLPFNPTDKRTALTYIDKAGTMHRVSKCAPEQEVPERNKDSSGGPGEFIALLPLFDPPRHDSAETIRRALELGVSDILHYGKSMENAMRACCKGIKIGKILIHRDGDNGKQLIYEKLPKDISERHVLLLDLVLGTGSVYAGVDFYKKLCGVSIVRSKRFPTLKIVTSEIDVALNEEFRVIPGMGEFGDRYFGTDD